MQKICAQKAVCHDCYSGKKGLAKQRYCKKRVFKGGKAHGGRHHIDHGVHRLVEFISSGDYKFERQVFHVFLNNGDYKEEKKRICSHRDPEKPRENSFIVEEEVFGENRDNGRCHSSDKRKNQEHFRLGPAVFVKIKKKPQDWRQEWEKYVSRVGGYQCGGHNPIIPQGLGMVI